MGSKKSEIQDSITIKGVYSNFCSSLLLPNAKGGGVNTQYVSIWQRNHKYNHKHITSRTITGLEIMQGVKVFILDNWDSTPPESRPSTTKRKRNRTAVEYERNDNRKLFGIGKIGGGKEEHFDNFNGTTNTNGIIKESYLESGKFVKV